MKYSKLINKKKEYKYSANICFDLENEERLLGFIPNATTVEILSEYLYGIGEGSNVHSRILYGSYGTGKSHLLTILCAILGHINVNSEGYNSLISKISKYDIELAKYIEKFSSDSKPYFVVPVYSDYHDFDKCISFSLKKELDRCGIYTCFNSYFQEAYDLLVKWQNGTESSTRLNETLEKLGIKIEDLLDGLSHFDKNTEKTFADVFKIMTYGASFVSETGNFIEDINVANEAIKDKYNGIIFVFDEFGRYVEEEGESIKVKTIQDLAEYCDHSENNDYVILVSHKQLSLYTDTMKKSVSDKWKKVEGRFKATSINVKYDQCLSLISHIIPKSKSWEPFNKKYKNELQELYAQAYGFKGFLLPPEGENPFEGGFPMHPITLYVLDRLSKRVAQNERTFFTYLASDERNALFNQLNEFDTKEFHFVGVDKIYDYFEVNIKSFRSDDVYAIYKSLQSAISKLGDQTENYIEIRILKTIAVINIIADTAVLTADRNTLECIIDAANQSIDDAIDNLERLKIIKYMRQSGFYEFFDSSIFDFDSMIEEKELSISDEMAINALNDEFINFVIYPHDYNAEYHMNRIFVPVFALKQDLRKKSFIRMLPSYYDGIVVLVLDDDYSCSEYTNTLDLPDRAILLINTCIAELLRETKRYIATKYYYSRRMELKQDDPTAEKELTIYLVEQKEIVSEIIKTWKNLSMHGVVAYANGERLKIKSEQEISVIASKIMEAAYPDTIIVNNDLVNKNNLSGTIRSSRNKVITSIIENDNFFEGFSLMSPEHTMLRSVLLLNGFCKITAKETINTIPQGKNVNIHAGLPVKKEIGRFLKKCEKAKIPLMELYNRLKLPPFGLRDGYISVLLAFELRNYENIALYFHGTERNYCAEELLNAMHKPGDYSLFLCNWAKEQRKYIVELESIFVDYLKPSAGNRLKELNDAMNLHYAAVSKLARTTEQHVSKLTKEYRQLMSSTHKDFNKFFFSDLLTFDNNLEVTVQIIKTAKQELENVLPSQVRSVEEVIRSIVSIKNDSLIAKGLAEKYSSEWSYKEQKTFDYQTNAFIDYAKTIKENNSDETSANDLAKIITGFEIDYWNDDTIKKFEIELKKIFKTLSDYHQNDILGENEMQIIIKSGNEEATSTRLDKCEISTNGQVMMNKIMSMVNNFGEGISREEKMVILAKLLSNLK